HKQSSPPLPCESPPRPIYTLSLHDALPISEGKLFERARRLAVLAAKGPASRRVLFEVRCDRGADIARTLGFSNDTARAIRCMDEDRKSTRLNSSHVEISYAVVCWKKKTRTG